MLDDVSKHHHLETELYRLRLLRDLRSPDYSTEAEDAVLDEMEALWYRMSLEDRRVLEAQREVRFGHEPGPMVRSAGTRTVDVDLDAYLRRGLSPRRVLEAS
jgi:hypothetical protein